MLTRCPQPACGHIYDANADSAICMCPQCGQTASFRSLDALKRLEQERRRRENSGGPVSTEDNQPRFSALLEDVRSLWNVGSIFRSADGAGFTHLYLCGITGSPPRKEIAKTSLGAEDYVSWEYHAGCLEVLPQLKQSGVQIVGLEYSDTSLPLAEVLQAGKLSAPLCLIVGNEDRGLSAQALQMCDYVCHLPMRGTKISLNVAVAFGVGAYFVSEHCYNLS